jgi:cytochrome c oxidase subunit 2
MLMTIQNMLAATHQGFVLPEQASTIARDIDPLTWFIHGITIFFSVGIILVTGWFAWKYRAAAHPIADPPGHNNVLELVWTVIPSIIVFVCFFWGFSVYMRMTAKHPGALPITANASMWAWQFEYPAAHNGVTGRDGNLYLPLNKPVEITLSSVDVLHALYLPAMRVKKDVVPGRFNSIQVTATKEGEYDLYCAEYCGDSHSNMRRKAIVLNDEAFKAKMIDISNPIKSDKTDAENGKNLASLNGCFSCHSDNGKAGTGPTWKDLYGAQGHPMSDGTTINVDDNYILQSIRNPQAHVVKGFGPPSAMNPFSTGQISDEYVQKYLIAYLKSISANAGTANPGTAQPQAIPGQENNAPNPAPAQH